MSAQEKTPSATPLRDDAPSDEQDLRPAFLRATPLDRTRMRVTAKAEKAGKADAAAEAAKPGEEPAAPPAPGRRRAEAGNSKPEVARPRKAVGKAGNRAGKGNSPARGTPPRHRQGPALPPVRPAAQKAQIQTRHIAIALSFLLFVLTPILVSSWYLWTRAADQYASYLGFSVRSETGGSSSELLGGISSLVGMTSSSTTDTDVLYKFIQSHDLVQRVDARLNLREIWSKAPNDPVFAYRGNDSTEDLLSEWERKVRVYYDNGMIDLRVLAFNAEDAQAITQAVYDESTVLINELNDVAREDALRYARQELDEALDRLKEARQAMTGFRNRHQMVDPTADVQGQIGVVTSLQQQLAEALVQVGLLRSNAQPNDPRIEQSELRIRVIREQIEAERQKFGSETATGEVLSDVVGQFETLSVDREFAERSYVAALAAYDTARAEAARQSRYLAAYIKPTLAQEAEYPERGKLLMILGGFLLILWIIGVLVFYSLRDRR